MSQEKFILKTIQKCEHITIKDENVSLLVAAKRLEKSGQIEMDYRFKNYSYFKLKGSSWRFPRKPNDFDFDIERDMV